MSKYQEVAKRVIEILDDDFILDMEVFNNNADGDDVSCGTAFCLAGWMAYKDKYPKEFHEYYGFDHTSYSEYISGCNNGSDKWEFLFGGDWSNDRTKAKARAQYVIDNDGCPNFSEWSEYD